MIVNRWPTWLEPEGAAMRAALRPRFSSARCAICQHLRPCRYSMVWSVFLCSEECWEKWVRIQEKTPAPTIRV